MLKGYSDDGTYIFWIDPGDELQASHPLRDGKVIVEDIEDNPGFFRVRLFAVPHFQIEGMDINLSLVSQMPKAKA